MCDRLQGSVISHWTFDREDASILVERLRGFVFLHGTSQRAMLPLAWFITLSRPFPQRRVCCQPMTSDMPFTNSSTLSLIQFCRDLD